MNKWAAPWVMLLLSTWASSSAPASGTPSEYEVKAAFLYNFAKFVTWPQDNHRDPAGDVIIGILGRDPFGPAFDQAIAGRTIGGRGLRIERFRSPMAAKRCHILFIGASETWSLDEIFDALSGWPILTVGDAPEFIQQGGMIRFFMMAEKVRFEINLDMAESADLRISSKLLRVAKVQGED